MYKVITYFIGNSDQDLLGLLGPLYIPTNIAGSEFSYIQLDFGGITLKDRLTEESTSSVREC